jgi:hypothetical protein
MNKRMRVTLGDEVGVAELFEGDAPNTVQAIWDNLPINGRVNHANFSGEETTFPCYGVMWERENEGHETVPGDLGYFVTGPAICIYYGDQNVISPGNVFGRVTENLAGIQRAARASWKQAGLPVLFERLEG